MMMKSEIRKVQECNIKVGDSVLVKPPRLYEISTPFNPIRHTVMEKRGSMIIAVSDVTNKRITRNSSSFKKISPEVRKDDIKKGTIPNILNIEHLGGSVNNGTVPHIIGIADVKDVETENLNVEENENVAGNEVPPTRNQIRERRRPALLRDDRVLSLHLMLVIYTHRGRTIIVYGKGVMFSI